MKFKHLALSLASAALLASCGQGSSTSSTTETSSSSTSKSSDSSKSTKPVIVIDEEYETDEWDLTIEAVLEKVVYEGDAYLVPAAKADKFVCGYTIDETTGLDLAIIRCYGILETRIESMYRTALKGAGYTMSSDSPVGYLEYTLVDDLCVQYELRQDSETKESFFEIMVYRYEYRIDYWPGEALKAVFGEDVPDVGADCYEVYDDIDPNMAPRVTLYGCHMDQDDVDAWTDKLEALGFEISTDSYYTKAISPNKNYHMMYDLEGNQLAVYITADWPYAYLMEILGYDLPRIDGAEFSFEFVKDGEFTPLAIYFDDVTMADFESYGSKLEAMHYEGQGAETKVYEGPLTITSETFIFFQGEEEIHNISLMYCEEQSSLAVALYY